MNILSLTGILPVPEVIASNDYLLPLYTAYKKQYPQDNITFLRTITGKFYVTAYKKIKRIKSYQLLNFPVTLIPFISIWRFPSLYSLISSYSLYWLNRKKIKNYLKDNAIDVIHAEYIIPDGYLAYLISKKYKIPYLITTHDELRYFNAAIAKNVSLRILKNASYITPLNYASDALYQKLGTRHGIIIPHGIDERFLNVRAEYSNNDIVQILTVAGLLAYKNIDRSLEAIAVLKDKYRIHYTIIGSGPELDKLQALKQSLKLDREVTFIEKIPYDRIPDEMSRYDIFLLPSYFETFGRVLFEAMAVGLPVVYAKNSGIHGYFKEGEEGLSVDHKNLNDIVEKLSVLIEDPTLRRNMGMNAKKLMYTYTWDKIAVTFHDLYDKAVRLKNRKK